MKENGKEKFKQMVFLEKLRLDDIWKGQRNIIDVDLRHLNLITNYWHHTLGF